MSYGQCPICKKKGTTQFKFEFICCDKHKAEDVFIFDYKQKVREACKRHLYCICEDIKQIQKMKGYELCPRCEFEKELGLKGGDD